MSTVSAPQTVRARPPLWAYAWWFAVGALGCVGLVGLLTIGMPFLLVAAGLAVGGSFIEATRNRSIAASAAGLSVIPLYLAWLNKDGPGEVCKPHNGGTMCGSEASPWPFLIVAVLMIATSIALIVVLVQMQRHRAPHSATNSH